jgi:hypothetical protein
MLGDWLVEGHQKIEKAIIWVSDIIGSPSVPVKDGEKSIEGLGPVY